MKYRVKKQAQVIWRTNDILDTSLPKHHFDFWHDRAVFHFLTQQEDREKYVAQVFNALKPGGKVINLWSRWSTQMQWFTNRPL